MVRGSTVGAPYLLRGHSGTKWAEVIVSVNAGHDLHPLSCLHPPSLYVLLHPALLLLTARVATVSLLLLHSRETQTLDHHRRFALACTEMQSYLLSGQSLGLLLLPALLLLNPQAAPLLSLPLQLL